MPKIVDHDARRDEIAHVACRVVAATAEQMFVNVDTKAKKSAPMPPPVYGKLLSLIHI